MVTRKFVTVIGIRAYWGRCVCFVVGLEAQDKGINGALRSR